MLASAIAALYGPHPLEVWQLLALFAVGTFWAWIGTILSFIGHALSVSLKFIVSKLSIALRYTYLALQAVAKAILGALLVIKDVILQLVTQWIPAAYRALSSWIGEAVDYLRKVFGPVYDAIKRVLSVVDWAWNKIVKPILDVLSAAESLLRLLDRLGLEWAGKLADALARVRLELIEAFQKVRKDVNDIRGVLGLLLDPRGWIARSPYAWSFAMFATDIFNIVGLFGLKNARLPFPTAIASIRVKRALDEWPPGLPPVDEGQKRALDEWDSIRAQH